MQKPTREYQENFFGLYEKFQDQENRRGKAEKIKYSLSNFSGRDLHDSICLDLGCSNGLISLEISSLFKTLVGLDYDGPAVFMTPRDKRDTNLFIHGDAMNLPFPDQSYDVIICSQVYEHVPDDSILFNEIYRVLRPGGIVFFSGPNKMFPIEPHYYLPFLHWLPEKWADRYLRFLNKGTHFYERSRSVNNLRKVFSQYQILDLAIPVIRFYRDRTKSGVNKTLYDVSLKIPKFLLYRLLYFLPNFNWVLIKSMIPQDKADYEILP